MKEISHSSIFSMFLRSFLPAIVFLSAVACSLPLFASAATEPITNLHFVTVDPADIPQVVALGFNMVIITSARPSDPSGDVALLDSLPTGVKGLVQYKGGCTGATQYFQTWANAFKDHPNLYGFYLYDEPTVSSCPPATLKAEADWVHANMPGVKTLVVIPEASPTSILADYADGQDFLGLDVYVCAPWYPNCSFSYLTGIVNGALNAGVPKAKIIPVYQAFADNVWTILPSAEQERQLLATWAALTPTPVFDYTFTWKPYGTMTTVADSPELQAVFKAHNASISADTQAPTVPQNLTAIAVSSSQINLAWTASTDNVGVTGYDIYRGGTLLTSVTGTSYQNTGLSANTTYSYQVRAQDAAGNPSALTSAVPATTQAPPANLISNPGFETGSLSPWAQWWGSVMWSTAGSIPVRMPCILLL